MIVEKVSKRVKKWKAKTEPDLVDVAYRLSRDIQVELGTHAQLKHDVLISKIKRLIEDNVSNPVLKHPYISYAQKVASLKEKYDINLASKQTAGEILKWETRGLNRELMIQIAETLGTRPRPFLEAIGAPSLVELSFCGVVVCETTIIPKGVTLTIGKYGVRVEEGGTLINDGVIKVEGG